ncbi:hypothetical protein [Pseudomonas vranovensis]|uniref:hypothetical protein n=1 Tax=Pseudomonas vranovensis TaxID=321661 RepID=UPI003D95DD65
MNNQTVVFNGINGADGNYLTAPLTPECLGQRLMQLNDPASDLESLKARDLKRQACFGLPLDIDGQALAQTGWAVIFARSARAEVRQALAPLLALRALEAGALYREFSGEAGYWPGDTARAWLARQPRGKSPGVVAPQKVPYYLMIVADPQDIPFRFQYELAVSYAVGRIHFDHLQGYHNYARSVVAAQAAEVASTRRALFFGPCNEADAATRLSCALLVEPLAQQLAKLSLEHWQVEQCVADQATKARLLGQLSGQPPSLLFTASHGMGFPCGDPRQLRHQGALLCQDWPGPQQHRGAIPADYYLSADDLDDHLCLAGSVMMHFCCYGAGTPLQDNFKHSNEALRQLASRPFLAALPMRALSLPAGAALAVIGHVERAWSYSFDWPGCGDDLATFKGTVQALMKGKRVGLAMDHFAMRHAEVAVALNGELDVLKDPIAKRDDLALGALWIASNDARNYVILGDPAVRLQVEV